MLLLGALTGVAALIFTGRVGSASPDAGTLKDSTLSPRALSAELVNGRPRDNIRRDVWER